MSRRGYPNTAFIVMFLVLVGFLIAGLALDGRGRWITHFVLLAALAVTIAAVRIAEARHRHSPAAIDRGFTIVLRGYDVAQVDALARQATEAVASNDPTVRASARNALRQANPGIRLRGYARVEVDEYLRQMRLKLEDSL